MGTTADLRNGLVIKYNNEPHIIVQFQHRTPGNLRAFYQVKMKNLNNGKMMENRLRSGESIDIIRMETRNFQYLYHDGQGYMFMDNENYNQVSILEDIVGEQGKWIKEGEQVQIMFDGEKPITVEIPPHVELKVTEAPPGIKASTATGGTKQVVLETGAVVNAPMFIDEGDTLRIDTRTGTYLERVKK